MSPEPDPRDFLLAAACGLLPEVRPPVDVAARLRATLLARLPAPRTVVLRSGEGEWRALLPGIEVKSLRLDPVIGSQTTLWRVAAGAAIPPHVHASEEECLVIEGSIVHEGIEYHAGDYLLAERGVRHGRFHSPAGALLLIRGEVLPGFSPALHG